MPGLAKGMIQKVKSWIICVKMCQVKATPNNTHPLPARHVLTVFEANAGLPIFCTWWWNMETISHALGLSIAKAAASKKTYLTITRHTKTHSQKIQNLNNPASLPMSHCFDIKSSGCYSGCGNEAIVGVRFCRILKHSIQDSEMLLHLAHDS